MSYQVLARKWRPRRFEDMVGQQHVLQALINALDQNRLHHAYLFTGTRGVGKTTLARILAKSLNCEQGVSSRPCGQCSACREIDEGRFVDLIEVDAASRTKVDETRELLENVVYAPTRGRYKVYLIDEVHMFSNHSFNALLKTLEEPPPHIKFLLATTDPKKLPVTILSRCLQFNLKRLTVAQIEAQLEKILTQEGIANDKTARHLIAEAADGSLRDALSLLDQAISYGGGALREQEVATMLGAIDRRQVHELLRLLAEHDAPGALALTARVAETSTDFSSVLVEMLSLLQRVAVVQALGASGTAADVEDDPQVQELARRLSPEDTQLYYQIAMVGRRDLPLAPDPHGGFDMVLLRMLTFQLRPGARTHASPASSPASKTSETPAPPSPAFESAPAAARAEPAGEWQEMINELGLNGLVRELAAHCVFLGIDGEQFRLALLPAQAHQRNPRIESRLEQAIQDRYGKHLKLVLSVQSLAAIETPAQQRDRREQEAQAAAAAAIESDPNVKALREKFGAVVENATPQRSGA
ncbi:MAG TPA: DNA polymerase III subunit gamma/tau [Gammaproteobacteria bacterium]|nr:DNA polymerase III subunit gamma/tau [Gammaproteobacteria bacterium]